MTEGKIVKALSGFYYVLAGGKVYQCRGRGVFRKQDITPLVGDYVKFKAENDREGYIMEVKQRKNELSRPPIANIDQVILVFSAVEPEFSVQLLDRFLTVVEANQMLPLICVTKADLMSEEDSRKISQYITDYRAIGYDVFLVSSMTGEGVDALRPYLEEKVSVLAGQSGVGKSALLNRLKPELQLKTGDVSFHLGRGRHTTRHVELLSIGNGLVADTPGFSSVELTSIELADLDRTFPEIHNYSFECKFRGCFHMNEPGCRVKVAVEEGDIRSYRYEHYKLFFKEIKERKPRY